MLIFVASEKYLDVQTAETSAQFIISVQKAEESFCGIHRYEKVTYKSTQGHFWILSLWLHLESPELRAVVMTDQPQQKEEMEIPSPNCR